MTQYQLAQFLLHTWLFQSSGIVQVTVMSVMSSGDPPSSRNTLFWFLELNRLSYLQGAENGSTDLHALVSLRGQVCLYSENISRYLLSFCFKRWYLWPVPLFHLCFYGYHDVLAFPFSLCFWVDLLYLAVALSCILRLTILVQCWWLWTTVENQ